MSAAHHARLSTAVAPVFDTQFDPVELIGSLIPFIDPFADDFGCFPSMRSKSAPAASQPTLASSLGRTEEIPASSQKAQFAPALLRTPSFPHVYPEPQPEVVPDRVRLTPEQAIDIFKKRRTKTPRTANKLAKKYSILPKAIRDIWKRNSWAQYTRPHWNE